MCIIKRLHNDKVLCKVYNAKSVYIVYNVCHARMRAICVVGKNSLPYHIHNMKYPLKIQFSYANSIVLMRRFSLEVWWWCIHVLSFIVCHLQEDKRVPPNPLESAFRLWFYPSRSSSFQYHHQHPCQESLESSYFA